MRAHVVDRLSPPAYNAIRLVKSRNEGERDGEREINKYHSALKVCVCARARMQKGPNGLHNEAFTLTGLSTHPGYVTN